MPTTGYAAPQQQSISLITANVLTVSGGTFTLLANAQTSNDHRKVIHESLKDYILPNAAHDADDATNPWPRCSPNTRTTLLANLEKQLQDPTKCSMILWVFGRSGIGKSSVAGSLSEILQERGRLGASFLYRIGDYEPKQNLIATIVYQLAISIPALQPHIAGALDANPFIFNQPLHTKMEELVVQPLLACNLSLPTIVVIDDFDKYRNKEMQCRLLSILGHAVSRLDGKLKFVIFTRPRTHIASAFDSEQLKPITVSINLENEPSTRDDIRIYLDKEIGQIAALHRASHISRRCWSSS